MFSTVLDDSRLVGGRDERIKMLSWLIVKGDDTSDSDGIMKYGIMEYRIMVEEG